MRQLDIAKLAQEHGFSTEQIREVTHAAALEQMLGPLTALAAEQREHPKNCEQALASLWQLFAEGVMKIAGEQMGSSTYVPMQILSEYFGHEGDLQAAVKCVRDRRTPQSQALLELLEPGLCATLAQSVQIWMPQAPRQEGC